MTRPATEPDASELAGYSVIVGICGGIAAYKVASLVSALVQRGAEVTVAMTAAAQKFITPLTFESLTARQVYTDLWHAENYHDPQHLNLTRKADVFVVAPATANMIGKMACGLADDLVSTMVMSAACPILLCPAMNTLMWENPIVQKNLESLRGHGYQVMPPGEGWLACRTIGAGRLPEPQDILSVVVSMLKQSPPKSASK
jgi:phosphopantothenoylcysteine decarboxylase/phosphopantothenate--cysteine ligase